VTVQIRVADETYTKLVRLGGFLEMKDGEKLSMGAIIEELLDRYPKQRLYLDEGDIFEVEGPDEPKQD
jgi:predicted CopG family antitoxin